MSEFGRPTDPREPPPPAGPDDLFDPSDPSQWAMHALLSVHFEQAEQDQDRRVRTILDRLAHERAAAATDKDLGSPSPVRPGMGERSPGRPPSARRWLGPVYAASGLLAAACIAFLVVPWWEGPPAFEAEVAAFAARAYGDPASAVRGDEVEPGRSGQQTLHPPAIADPQAWISVTLDDTAVSDALATHAATGGIILGELDRGRLRLTPDGRIELAQSVDQSSAQGGRLLDLIEEDRTASQNIVDALTRHLPGATSKHQASLSQALNRWRAEHVFGGD